MIIRLRQSQLTHYGVPGMRWGKRKNRLMQKRIERLGREESRASPSNKIFYSAYKKYEKLYPNVVNNADGYKKVKGVSKKDAFSVYRAYDGLLSIINGGMYADGPNNKSERSHSKRLAKMIKRIEKKELPKYFKGRDGHDVAGHFTGVKKKRFLDLRPANVSALVGKQKFDVNTYNRLVDKNNRITDRKLIRAINKVGKKDTYHNRKKYFYKTMSKTKNRWMK